MCVSNGGEMAEVGGEVNTWALGIWGRRHFQLPGRGRRRGRLEGQRLASLPFSLPFTPGLAQYLHLDRDRISEQVTGVVSSALIICVPSSPTLTP